ncbi:hypothetical protein, partial [Pseudomonas azotoformans]
MAQLPDVKPLVAEKSNPALADASLSATPRAFKIKTLITWLVLLSLLFSLFGKMGLQWDLIEQKL